VDRKRKRTGGSLKRWEKYITSTGDYDRGTPQEKREGGGPLTNLRDQGSPRKKREAKKGNGGKKNNQVFTVGGG